MTETEIVPEPNVEALERLIDILANVPDSQFDISLFDCGTHACALGHAGRDPWFQDRGFRSRLGSVVYVWDGQDVLYNARASQQFFGLTRDQAHAIFFDGAVTRGVTPAEVADRIRLFLREIAVDGPKAK